MFFFFNDTATTEIYTLSLHDALPISDEIAPAADGKSLRVVWRRWAMIGSKAGQLVDPHIVRSEEHTSELQSHLNLVCRLLLEKKKTCDTNTQTSPTPLISSHNTTIHT